MFQDLSLMNRLGFTSISRVHCSMMVSYKFIAGMSSMRNPASSEKISASALLWDTAVCFLRAHEIGINVCDPNTEHHPKLTLSPSNFLQNRRLGKISVCSLSLASQRDNTVWSWTCDECDWWDVLVADRTLSSFLWLIWPSNSMSEVNVAFQCLPSASVFYSIWERDSDKSPTISKKKFQKMVIVQTRCGNLLELVNRLVRQVATTFNTLLTVTFHVIAPSCDVFGICLFGFDTILLWSCAVRRVHPRYTWSANDTGSSKPTFFFLQFCSTSSACV